MSRIGFDIGTHGYPCIFGKSSIIDPTNTLGDHMARYLDNILLDQSENVKSFADHIASRPDVRVDYRNQKPRLVELAMWGITEQEWDLVGRAFHIESVSRRLSSKCPAVILVRSTGEETAHRMVIMPNQNIRGQVIEDWLGRELTPDDIGNLQELSEALPAGWIIVLEGRSHHRQEFDT